MPDKIKIAYITSIPVTQYNCLRGQNDYFANNGFEIHAISSSGKYLDKLAERDKVTTHPVEISRSISPLKDLVSLFRLIKVLLKIKPDILHVSTPKGGLLGAIAGWLCRIPCRIFLIRGLVSSGRSGLSGKIFKHVEAITASLSHQSIAVSESLLQYAHDNNIVATDKGFVAAKGMSNGIDAELLHKFEPLPDSVKEFIGQKNTIIGFSGRLTRDKGIEELATVWHKLREEYPQTKLLLCGVYEDGDPIDKTIIANLAADERVLITGWIEKQNLGAYYDNIDIFVFPSYREGFPNGPMEAAAFSLPVITTNAIGCKDAVLDSVTGQMIPVRDIPALDKALRLYLDQPQLRFIHGKAGYKRVITDFKPEVIWHALHEEYLRLLKT